MSLAGTNPGALPTLMASPQLILSSYRDISAADRDDTHALYNALPNKGVFLKDHLVPEAMHS